MTMEPMTPGAMTAANLNRDRERVHELEAENERLREGIRELADWAAPHNVRFARKAWALLDEEN